MIGEENAATTDDLRDVTPGRYAALMDEVMTLRRENDRLKQHRPAADYHWQWMKPDRPGLWAFGGRTQDSTSGTYIVVEIIDAPSNDPGWWCFLMDLPTIKPPKKKAVWRLWVTALKGAGDTLREEWFREDCDPCREYYRKCYQTTVTEEREE